MLQVEPATMPVRDPFGNVGYAQPGRSPALPARATGPQVQGCASPGRPPQRAKAACRRCHALPGCCAALQKYKTIVTAWRLEQSSKGRRRESKPPFERLERFFPAGGFLEVTSTAARMRLPYTRPRERQKPFPLQLLSFKTGRRPFLELGGFPFWFSFLPTPFLQFSRHLFDRLAGGALLSVSTERRQRATRAAPWTRTAKGVGRCVSDPLTPPSPLGLECSLAP